MTLTVNSADPYAERLLGAGRLELLTMLSRATEEEARTAVKTLGLRDLFELPREIVENWPGDPRTPGTARFIRAERLTTERWVPVDAPKNDVCGRWRLADIAAAVNVGINAVGRWRSFTNNGDPDWKKCLPLHEASIGEVKQPGDPRGKRGGHGIPLFEQSVVLNWLKRTKKVTDDLYPHPRSRGGGIPTGRPPKQRSE